MGGGAEVGGGAMKWFIGENGRGGTAVAIVGCFGAGAGVGAGGGTGVGGGAGIGAFTGGCVGRVGFGMGGLVTGTFLALRGD